MAGLSEVPVSPQRVSTYTLWAKHFHAGPRGVVMTTQNENYGEDSPENSVPCPCDLHVWITIHDIRQTYKLAVSTDHRSSNAHYSNEFSPVRLPLTLVLSLIKLSLALHIGTPKNVVLAVCSPPCSPIGSPNVYSPALFRF